METIPLTFLFVSTPDLIGKFRFYYQEVKNPLVHVKSTANNVGLWRLFSNFTNWFLPLFFRTTVDRNVKFIFLYLYHCHPRYINDDYLEFWKSRKPLSLSKSLTTQYVIIYPSSLNCQQILSVYQKTLSFIWRLFVVTTDPE